MLPPHERADQRDDGEHGQAGKPHGAPRRFRSPGEESRIAANAGLHIGSGSLDSRRSAPSHHDIPGGEQGVSLQTLGRWGEVHDEAILAAYALEKRILVVE